MFRQILLLFFSFAFSLIAPAQVAPAKLQQIISNWQNSPQLQNASVGLTFADTKTGEILAQSEPQLSLVPASILKLVTTATALETFGPDFRFQTSLSYSGEIRNDTLFGNLQITGGGDPTLASSYFPEYRAFQDEWIDVLREQNISVIAGDIVADDRIYEAQSIPDTWIWEDIGNYYGAGASGLSAFDNLYEIHLSSPATPGLPTTIKGIVPEIPDLEIENQVLSSDLNSDQAYVFGSPTDTKRIIRGTIPKSKTDFVVKASVPDPALLLASEFRKKLLENRIAISGKARHDKTEIPAHNLAVHSSPPLAEIIKVTNHESVNLFAEHLLKHLAFKTFGLGATKNGCKVIAGFWKEKGMESNGFFMNDGSGLSRFNSITSGQLVFILNYMKNRSRYADTFVGSLAGPGTGTLTVFDDADFPGNSLQAKSGSMTRVRCYAGYLETQSGKTLAFTVMLNNFSCSQSAAIRKIGELLKSLRESL